MKTCFAKYWERCEKLRVLREGYDRQLRTNDQNDAKLWAAVKKVHDTWCFRFNVIVNMLLNSVLLVKSGKATQESVAPAQRQWDEARNSKLISVATVDTKTGKDATDETKETDKEFRITLNSEEALAACRAILNAYSVLPKEARVRNRSIACKIVNDSQIFTMVFYDSITQNRRSLVVPLVTDIVAELPEDVATKIKGETSSTDGHTV